MCFTLRLHMSAAPPQGGLTQALGPMKSYDELEDETFSMGPIDARLFLTIAAELGNPAAQCLLADCLDDGTLDIVDPEQSVAWYRRSAAQGFTRAEFYLGSMLAFGRGTSQDRIEAISWLRRAASKGDSAAQFRVGEMLFNDGEIQEGTQHLALAAAQGHESAVELLSTLPSRA
jgi:TPR repeat protein